MLYLRVVVRNNRDNGYKAMCPVPCSRGAVVTVLMCRASYYRDVPFVKIIQPSLSCQDISVKAQLILEANQSYPGHLEMIHNKNYKNKQNHLHPQVPREQ